MTPREAIRDKALSHRWTAYWDGIDNERILAAGALLDLSSTVREDVAKSLRTDNEPLFNDDGDEVGEQDYVTLDWDGWATDVEATRPPVLVDRSQSRKTGRRFGHQQTNQPRPGPRVHRILGNRAVEGPSGLGHRRKQP